MRRRSQPTTPEKARFHEPDVPTGTLYVVGTPIGSLDGITLRAIDVLRQVRIIAAETPRTTQVLLSRYGIHNHVISYGPHNLQEKIAVLIDELHRGNDIALVSDSGMPVIFDPGRLLITAAHRTGLRVKSVPGPSAMTAAVALSGFSGDRVLFEGNLPDTGPRLLRFFAQLKHEPRTTVLFVRSGTITTVLKALAKVLPDRAAALAISMDSAEESLLHGPAKTLSARMSTVPSAADVTLVLKGKTLRR